MSKFEANEVNQSQIPALKFLISLGYNYLSPMQALAMRGGKTSNVLLESVLREQLQKINHIKYKNEKHYFSEKNIQESIQKMKYIKYDGLQKTNENVYDMLTLGTALEQNIDGDSKSYTLNYVDWSNPTNNVFHVVPEFAVERSRSNEIVIPDIVLFVNGIPMAVIECKSPTVEIEQAISQFIRNQSDEYIPHLFTYVQLVLGINKNSSKYGTVGTPAKFWSVWKEQDDVDEKIAMQINSPLTDQQKDDLFSGKFEIERNFFDKLEYAGKRLVTEQDRALFCLCRPDRLLDLTYRFTLFEAGSKKIARYQQFFVTHSTMARIKRISRQGHRAGGVIWHTQGSGKSLTMVMFVRALVLDPEIKNPRIILVTDRDDLDKQLGNTFAACGLSRERATSSRNLVKHLKNKVGIITTLIHKFKRGWESQKYVDNSHNIFVLVDESHRTNFGELASTMRQMLSNACYLGFTGTPLLKREKNNFAKFGNLIEPHYSIRQAVKDNAVLPLLYEGRLVEMEQNRIAIDTWFERHTSDLSLKEQAILKSKYANAKSLNGADRVIYMRAFDISEHFRVNWQGTGFKGQLVAKTKIEALKYHEYLEEIGHVSSAVVISPPDFREGHEEVNEGSSDEVGKYWAKIIARFGSETEYTNQTINRFKNFDEPEIIIVVDKLLTGFDAPRNTVLYLCRTLREHSLLQAIARVNRLHEGKEYGYIVDYESELGELDKALTMYDAFEGFDMEDLVGTLGSIYELVSNLPQKYSDLWEIFKEVKNKQDQEALEILLADEELRDEFYERLSEYRKILGIALSTRKFVMETDEEKLQMYKDTLKRFQNLKKSVKLRYAEIIDYRDYEPKIKKLLDTHIQANEVTQLNEPVNIFDKESFDAVIQGKGNYSNFSNAAKADTIAHATKKVIHEMMDQDPAFYGKFSELIQKVIDEFKSRRISDSNYLRKVGKIREEVVSKRHDDVPNLIRNNDEACAYFGIINPILKKNNEKINGIQEIAAEISLEILEIIEKNIIVDYWTDFDAQRTTKGEIDDFLIDEVSIRYNLNLSEDQMDEIIEKTMRIAKNRRLS